MGGKFCGKFSKYAELEMLFCLVGCSGRKCESAEEDGTSAESGSQPLHQGQGKQMEFDAHFDDHVHFVILSFHRMGTRPSTWRHCATTASLWRHCCDVAEEDASTLSTRLAPS